MQRLAFLLRKTVPELLATLGGTRELARWMAYFELEPPDKPAWERTAMQCLVTAKMAGDKTSNLGTFMPAYPERVQSQKEQIAAMRAALAGKVQNG